MAGDFDSLILGELIDQGLAKGGKTGATLSEVLAGYYQPGSETSKVFPSVGGSSGGALAAGSKCRAHLAAWASGFQFESSSNNLDSDSKAAIEKEIEVYADLAVAVTKVSNPMACGACLFNPKNCPCICAGCEDNVKKAAAKVVAFLEGAAAKEVSQCACVPGTDANDKACASTEARTSTTTTAVDTTAVDSTTTRFPDTTATTASADGATTTAAETTTTTVSESVATTADSTTTAVADTTATIVTTDSIAPTTTTVSSSCGARQSTDRYNSVSNWICSPKKSFGAHTCATDTESTDVSSSGARRLVEAKAVSDSAAKVDCFYVYPTTSLDQKGNSDFSYADDQENFMVKSQAAAYSSVCSVWAPVYQQLTAMDLAGFVNGDNDLAFTDIQDAFRTFLATRKDQTRPFLLIGHSQGAQHLAKILKEEVAPCPEVQSRLVAAHLIGAPPGTVLVDKDAEGSSTTTPACTSATQTGCIVAFNSFETQGPQDCAFSSNVLSTLPEGLKIPCVSPQALLKSSTTQGRWLLSPTAGGSSKSGLYGMIKTMLPGGKDAHLYQPGPYADNKLNAAKINTDFFSMNGRFAAECKSACDGKFEYLFFSVNDPDDNSDPRPAVIAGTMPKNAFIDGSHLADVNLALESLVELARQQSKAWGKFNDKDLPKWTYKDLDTMTPPVTTTTITASTSTTRTTHTDTTSTTTTTTTTTSATTKTATTKTVTSTTTTGTGTSTTIFDPGNVDCIEVQDACTAGCERSGERNYKVVAPSNKKGKVCNGPLDCMPGDGACPTTSTTRTISTTTTTTTTQTTKTVTTKTATTRTNTTTATETTTTVTPTTITVAGLVNIGAANAAGSTGGGQDAAGENLGLTIGIVVGAAAVFMLITILIIVVLAKRRETASNATFGDREVIENPMYDTRAVTSAGEVVTGTAGADGGSPVYVERASMPASSLAANAVPAVVGGGEGDGGEEDEFEC